MPDTKRSATILTIAAAVGIRPDQVEAVIAWLEDEAADEAARVNAEEIDELARQRAWRASGGPAVHPGSGW